MPSQSHFATVEQDAPSKPPILTAGKITPAGMCSYENACLSYFENKDIAEEKQVRKVLGGLQDSHLQDWVDIDREHFLALSFIDFMVQFRAGYLPEDWEEVTHIELLGMIQEDQSFRDFAVKIQAKNSLLCNTTSYLDQEKLCHRIKSGMNQKLALHCRLEKLSKVEDFEKWLAEIRRIDDLMKAEKAEFESFARTTCETTRRANALAEPSHHGNAPTVTAAPAASDSCLVLPKLLESERRLLYDNEGCLKCRRVFVDHRSTNCPNNFPNPSTYKTLTQNFVDAIKNRIKRPVAVVVNSDATSVTAVPVAAVMGSSINPVAYMPTNASNVLEGASNDDSVSVLATVAATVTADITDTNVTVPVLMALPDLLALLSVPHLFWRCSTSGAPDTLPVAFEALIDPGSHLVLINESFARSLALKRRKLLELLPVEMAIPGEGKKVVIQLSEWVKLHLYNPSGSWTARTVRAVIAPSLCAPLILQMPFLSHNHIVIDLASRTVIDKVAGFDLLHPTPPPTVPKPPKRKLKEFFRDLKADRKLMVAELKMICAERHCKLVGKMEEVKPFDTVTAMRVCIEALTSQMQLD
jgi:hypothetical protein